MGQEQGDGACREAFPVQRGLATQRTGMPYQTRPDPPSATPRIAPPEGARPAWAKKEAR